MFVFHTMQDNAMQNINCETKLDNIVISSLNAEQQKIFDELVQQIPEDDVFIQNKVNITFE